MAKRSASSDVNHENWDQPLEPEEAGVFSVAPQDTLHKRVIKTAKRRLKPSENNEAVKSIFTSFTGFKPTVPMPSSTGSTKPFGFLGATTSAISVTPSTNGTTLTVQATKTEVTTPQQKYHSNLQQLNCSVSNWIKTHVDSNPVCILTPVFNDYEKHLKQIQAERDISEKTTSTPVPSTPNNLSSLSFVRSSNTGTESNNFTINIPTTSTTKKTFTFTDTNLNLSPLNSDKQSPSLFGFKDTGKSPLLEGNNSSKSTTPSIFSSFKSTSTGSSLLSKPDPAALMVNPFTSAIVKEEKAEGKSFSISNGSPLTSSTSTKKKEEEDEDSEEPPKVEFTPVQEEGAVFSTRCKVFVKKDGYKERGVGTLFIKKVGEEKHQLLVRAETVLGNILVNVLLSSSIPTQRMGKNNVMLVCIPTPQDPPPPTTVLLRVKTPAEADDLLATIDQYKH